MVKFEVYHATQFKELLEVLEVLNEDYVFQFDQSGVATKVMDDSHVAMLNMALPNDYFDQWYIEEPTSLSLNIPTILKAMGKVSKDEELFVDWITETNTVETEVDGVKTSKSVTTIPKMIWTLRSNLKREKRIPHSEIEPEEMPMPKIFFKSKARILLRDLVRVLSDFKASEHVKISIVNDSVHLDSVGDAYADHVQFDKGCDQLIDIRIEEESVSNFTLSYLVNILKEAVKISDVVTLELSTDMPLCIDFEMPVGELKFWIAPCIGW